MLKMNIYKFEYSGSNSNNDNIYFAGKLDDGDHSREFCTSVFKDAGSSLHSFSDGVYYFNIQDNKEWDSYNVNINFGAYCDKDGKDKKLDCDGDSDGYISEFKYYPEKNGVKGDVEWTENEVNDKVISTTEGYTQVELLGDNGNDKIRVWMKFTFTYADKMNTYLITQEDSITRIGESGTRGSGESQVIRYSGDDQYYLIFVKDKTYDGHNEHTIIVPKSIFYGSNFYAASQSENGLGGLYYISSDSGKFITRDYTSNGAAKEVEGVIKLESVTSMSSLFHDLMYDPEDNPIAIKERLNPYQERNRDDSQEDMDYIHSIGLSYRVMQFIPNAPKVTESANRDISDDEGGFGFKISLNDVTKWIGDGLEYIADLAVTLGKYGYEFVKGFEGVSEIAEMIEKGRNMFKEQTIEIFKKMVAAALTRTGELSGIPSLDISSLDDSDGYIDSDEKDDFIENNDIEADKGEGKSSALYYPLKFIGRFVGTIISFNEVMDILFDVLSNTVGDSVVKKVYDIFCDLLPLSLSESRGSDEDTVINFFTTAVSRLLEDVIPDWVGDDADITKMYIDTETNEDFLDETVSNAYTELIDHQRISTNPTGNHATTDPNADLRNNGVISFAPLNSDFPIIINFGIPIPPGLSVTGFFLSLVFGNLRDFKHENFCGIYFYTGLVHTETWLTLINPAFEALDYMGFSIGIPWGDRDHENMFVQMGPLDVAQDCTFGSGTIDQSFTTYGLGLEYWIPLIFSTTTDG